MEKDARRILEGQQPSEVIKQKKTMLDRVLERRGLDSTALSFIKKWVQFPDLILTPTNSTFKITFLDGFIKSLELEKEVSVMGIKVPSNVHEQPLGPETKDGADRRTANAALKASSGNTGNPSLDKLLREGKSCGYIGAIENGMVEGETDSDGNVHLNLSKADYDPAAEHFDVAYALVYFSSQSPVTVVSPSNEAVRFNPLDANASAASGFNTTAGEFMQKRLLQSNIHIDKQNWHGYAIQLEIDEAIRRRAAGLSTVGLHTEEFENFDRNEQLTGVLFDAFYALATSIETANSSS